MDLRRKNKKVNMGSWELQRERLRIADRTPPSPAQEAKTIGMLIPNILKEIKPRSSGIIFLIEQKWPDVAGKYASHSKPVKVEQGVLTVSIDSSVWLSELSRFGKKSIIDALGRQIGKEIVTDLRLTLGSG